MVAVIVDEQEKGVKVREQRGKNGLKSNETSNNTKTPIKRETERNRKQTTRY